MFAKRDLILGQEYFGFLLLNVFDLFLTGWIFKHEGQEANGVALWVLSRWGLPGFAIFKFIMVSFLVVICEVIAMFNLQKARYVILGGCALYVAVVLYECFLIYHYIDVSPGAASATATLLAHLAHVAPPTVLSVAVSM